MAIPTGGFGSRFRVSCLIGQPLALRAFDRNGFALDVIDAELGARVLPKIELGQVAVKVLGVDMLVNADDATLEDREETFERVSVHVATPPLKFGMVNRAVTRRAGKLKHRGAIRHQAAGAIKLTVEQATNAAMVDDHGTNRATALHKAENLDVALAAPGATARLGRAAHFHVVGFDRLASTSNRAALVRRHHFADAMPEVPRGFHAAAKHPLKLARRDAFFRGAKQMDGLQPDAQGKVAVLENRTLAHRKGRTTAGVAFAQSDLDDAFRVLLAGLGVDACQAADPVAERPTMRARRAFRPQLAFDVIESGFLAKEPRIGKDGLGHG